jgi:fumarate reductase flavoprotein subunit
MKSKTICLLALPLLLFSLAACSTGTEPSGQPSLYQAGTYTGQADGYGGIIKVSAIFSDDSITAISVDSHKETQSRPAVSAALEQIPQSILAGQTLVVDAIASATRTSRGILKAVEECARVAGGESAVEKLLAPPEK